MNNYFRNMLDVDSPLRLFFLKIKLVQSYKTGEMVKMDYKTAKKNLLFIEPFMSSKSFIYDAQVNGYGTFILSDNDSYLHIPKENSKVSSIFFQVDTCDEQSVLSILKQINQKFAIHGIVPEYDKYNLLSAKIAYHFKKPGLNPQAVHEIQKDKFLSNRSSIEKERKYFEHKEEYRIDGLVNKKNVYILSVTEKLFFTELENSEEVYIVRAEIDPLIFRKITDFLQKVTSDLKVDYGFFYAQINHQDREIILLKFKMGFAKKHMSKLISHATGIAYNHLVYKLFSSQSLSLHTGKKLNVGIIFFYKNFMRGKAVKQLLEDKNGCVIEIKDYDQVSIFDHSLSQKNSYKGYVLLKHEDYGILKDHIEKILLKSE